MYVITFPILFLLLCIILSVADPTKIAKPGCKDMCGNISIPYPFGIGSSCSFGRWAEVRCDSTFNPPKLFFTYDIPYEVISLSSIFYTHSLRSEFYRSVRIKHNISRICSDRFGAITSSHDLVLGLEKTPFRLSTGTKLTVIGCYIYGVISWLGDRSYNFMRSCTTVCDELENSNEGKCSGSGCCQISLDAVAEPASARVRPSNTWNLQQTFFRIFRGAMYSVHVEALNVSGITKRRCGSAFLTHEEYKFKTFDIQSLKETTVRLDFQFGNETSGCEVARKDPSSFACKGNSECHDTSGGYYCQCPEGIEGNPYLDLDRGCQGTCDDLQKNMCRFKCIKISRGYRCTGNGNVNPFSRKWIILGVILGLLLLGCVWMYYTKRKKLMKLGDKLVKLNARLLLIQEISSHAKIFTAEKLQQATKNFHESRILGQGGYGTVYKGILPDEVIVAVKKSNIIRKGQFEEFVNEVAILAKIDHRNIVKLLGCSVEVEHPLLVYEFVSNGTLSDHIFKKGGTHSLMTWKNRLRIAAEVAGALAYLHSAASVPIIHRDIKSSNILLDDSFTAKVADFGVSKLNHLDQTAISTLVKGTFGYLDPEYVLTSQLTEKSDVFSFGVVLAELLTGKKSICFERTSGEVNLAIHFTASMNEDGLLHIVEEGMVNEENIKQIEAVAALGQRCLNFKGEERPHMKEVASELEALRGFGKRRPSSETTVYPTCTINNGASGNSVAEITMSEMVPR